MSKRAIGTILLGMALVACGPPPPPAAQAVASGTLVVVITTGPERVPFKPKLARIKRANEQLAARLGHSLEIELDGSLLPQTEEGAEDVVARLVEAVAQDVDALAKSEPKALDFVRARFERLVVRYSPTDAAEREERWRRRGAGAKLDASTKTVDVARGKGDGWLALERGEIAGALLSAYRAEEKDRYARVLPDALPRAERRNWYAYHQHGQSEPDESLHVGSIHVVSLRGMIVLHSIAKKDGDADLARDARTWLIGAVKDFSSTYHHAAAKVESAPQGSPFKTAESAYIAWLRAELASMSVEELGVVAKHLFVTDFRKNGSERDRFAAYAFPGLDVMAFADAAIDAWIRAGHPHERPVPPLFEEIVCPVAIETDGAHVKVNEVGRCDRMFYRWTFATPAREEAFAARMLARRDEAFALAAFNGARHELKGADYLRFLRRFEGDFGTWKIGSDLQRDWTYRPDAPLLEEARRLWRTSPSTRGRMLFWFARHLESSYDPARDWADVLQGTQADEGVLASHLEAGWEAFELLPTTWPALAKNGGRVRVITRAAKPLLDARIPARPGGRGVAGTLERIATLLCEERATGELAELRAFAQAELAARPGAGLSDVVAATDPKTCSPKPKAQAPARPRAVKPPTDPNLFPPKPPLPPGER